MLREAELFAMAEVMLVEVLGRIRDQDRDIVLPPLTDLPGAEKASPMGTIAERYAEDDACVPTILAGGSADAVERDDPDVTRIAEAARAAAFAVSDGDAIVHARYGDVTTRHYLLRLSVNRSLVAHYVAAYLGSTACPLPEELARPLLELTGPDAGTWRSLGIFHEPMPAPDLASWRDRFLLMAGHLPHPLGH